MIRRYFLLVFGLLTSTSFSQEAPREVLITYKDGKEIPANLPEGEISNYQALDLQANRGTLTIQPQEVLKISSPDNGYLILPYLDNGTWYFMEALVLGEANLFFLKDEHGRSRFIAQLDEERFQELSSGKTTSRIDGRDYSVNSNSYLGTLNLLFSNCPPDNINKTKISFRSLIKAFTEYNRCRKNLGYHHDISEPIGELRLSLLAGASLNTISPATSTLAGNFRTDTGINTGVEVSYLFSRVALALGAFYAEKGGIGDYSLSNYNKAIFEYRFLELGISGRFNILGKDAKIQPYVGVTVNKGVIISETTTKRTSGGEEVDFYKGTTIQPRTTIPFALSYEAGLNYVINETGGIVIRGTYYNHEDGVDQFQFSGVTALIGYYFSL